MKTTSLLTISAVLIIASCSDGGPKSRIGSNGGSAGADGSKCLQVVNLAAPVLAWKGDIAPIFTRDCGSCHPGSQKTDYNSYLGVTKNITTVMAYIAKGSMPPKGPLDAGDQKLLADWIALGMPEVGTAAQTVPNPYGTSPTAQQGTTSPSTSPDCQQVGNNSTGGAGGATTGSPSSATTGLPSGATTGLPSGATTGLPSGATTGSPATAVPSYALGVKPLMDQYCISCHGTSGKSPALDTLAKVKANYAKIVSTMKSGSMPEGPVKVPAGAQGMFVKWGTSPNAPYGQWAP